VAGAGSALRTARLTREAGVAHHRPEERLDFPREHEPGRQIGGDRDDDLPRGYAGVPSQAERKTKNTAPRMHSAAKT
jgi:hypothetical protein